MIESSSEPSHFKKLHSPADGEEEEVLLCTLIFMYRHVGKAGQVLVLSNLVKTSEITASE